MVKKIILMGISCLILTFCLSFTITELILGNFIDALVEMNIKESVRNTYVLNDNNNQKGADTKIGDIDYKLFTRKWTKIILIIQLPISVFLSYRISFFSLYKFIKKKNRKVISPFDLNIVRITTVIVLFFVLSFIFILILAILEFILFHNCYIPFFDKKSPNENSWRFYF